MIRMLKRIAVCIVILLTAALSALPAAAAESYIVFQGFSFTVQADGGAVIHSYDDRSADVVIPQKLLGADVRHIHDYAFFGDETITSVSFTQADRLQTIGVNAFNGCTKLTAAEIPSWLETLSFGAFQNCVSLSQAVICNGIGEIPAQCFYGCAALRRISIPESVTSIGDRAFMDCAALTAAEIPDSVTHISDNAFDGCENVVISCTKGSYARQYAAENRLPFVVTDGIMYLLGEVNGDRHISISDVTAIQRSLAELEHLDETRLRAADVNRDGTVNIADATELQKYLAEFGSDYPVGEMMIE